MFIIVSGLVPYFFPPIVSISCPDAHAPLVVWDRDYPAVINNSYGSGTMRSRKALQRRWSFLADVQVSRAEFMQNYFLWYVVPTHYFRIIFSRAREAVF